MVWVCFNDQLPPIGGLGSTLGEIGTENIGGISKLELKEQLDELREREAETVEPWDSNLPYEKGGKSQ